MLTDCFRGWWGAGNSCQRSWARLITRKELILKPIQGKTAGGKKDVPGRNGMGPIRWDSCRAGGEGCGPWGPTARWHLPLLQGWLEDELLNLFDLVAPNMEPFVMLEIYLRGLLWTFSEVMHEMKPSAQCLTKCTYSYLTILPLKKTKTKNPSALVFSISILAFIAKSETIENGI